MEVSRDGKLGMALHQVTAWKIVGWQPGRAMWMASSHGMAVRQLSSEEEATACVKDG